MHDPLVQVVSIPSPVPRRARLRDAKPGEERWSIRRRRTEKGEPVYPWWRPRGYAPVLAGRAWELREAVVIWHKEPGGADSFEVCKNRRQKRDGKWVYHDRWRWHVHHWTITVRLEQRLRRFLFERCERCGYRFPWGYAPVAHGWNTPRSRWFRVERRAFHRECSVLVSREQQVADLEEVIRLLVAQYRVALDLPEEEAVDRLCGLRSPFEFRIGYRLQRLLGWERDGDYRLVRSADVEARRVADRERRRAMA